MARLAAGWGSGVLALATLVWSSGEDVFLGPLLPFVVFGWAGLGAWGLVSVARAVRAGTGRQWVRNDAPVWIAGAIVLVASFGLGVAGVSQHVRFALSRSALSRAGQDVLAGERPTRAGLYDLLRTRVDSEGCAVLTTGMAFISEFGYVYCPGPGGGRLTPYDMD